MADLKIKIKGDASSLNNAVNQSQSRIQKFGNAVKTAFVGIIGGFAAAGSALRTMLSFINPVATKLDDIGKAARRIGIGSDDFQKLSFAARRTGVDTGTVEKSFKRMQKTIGDAGRGLATAKDSLEKLGLSFDMLQNKSPMEQFELIAGRLANMENATLRNAAAQDVFGRSGLAIAPLISEYGELSRHLQDINGLMSEDAVKAAEDYKDAIEDLSTTFDSLIAASGAIRELADSMRLLEESIAGIRREGGGLDFLKNIATNVTKGGFTPSFIPDTIIRAFGDVGKREQAARIVNEEIRRNRAKQGALGGATGGVSTTAGRLLSGGVLGGGGTFESLGGDISGGGFAARMTVAQEQLSVQKEIKSIAQQLLETSLQGSGYTQKQINNYLSDVQEAFNGN